MQAESWCLVAVCTGCRVPTLLFRNVPERLSQIGGKYSMTCAHCGQRDSFPIERTREAEQKSVQPSDQTIAG